MASLATPKTWIPYMNTRDCTQGFCSLYCPQWCYIVFPPPPPVEFPGDTSSSSFSPLVIAIIGILASAFLLITYYTIISKYCGDNDPSRRGENQVQNVELGEENRDPSLHEAWQASTIGLDEALIKSIAVYKYRKGDGAIGGTDCSVCISEFEDDQSVRLLPKCSHAFHVACIDTWLKSHSNCPLCRANIFFASAPMPRSPPPPPPPQPVEHHQSNNGSSTRNGQGDNENAPAADQNPERVVTGEEMELDNRAPEAPMRAFSELGNLHQRDIISEVRDRGRLDMRRTVSMDHHRSCQAPSGTEAWQIDPDDLVSLEEGYSEELGVGTSKHPTGGASMTSKSTPRTKAVLHCLLRSPLAAKRSSPSGRFFASPRGRSRDTAISPA